MPRLTSTAIAAAMLLAAVGTAQATPIQFGSFTYRLTANAESWTAAEAEAVADGGHLASIPSQAVQDFLVSNFLTGAFTTLPLWIGFFDPHTGDGCCTQHTADFQWSDGSSITYTNWNPSEPSNSGAGEYFTAMNWHHALEPDLLPIGTWNDLADAGTPPTESRVDGPYFGIIEIPAAIPEPASITLLAAAFLGLGLSRRRLYALRLRTVELKSSALLRS